MTRALAAALMLLGTATLARAAPPDPAETRVASCLKAVSDGYRVPPALILILLNVEGGRLGEASANSNHTSDLGPMQVNTIWVPVVARHWHTTPEAAFTALRDSFCANLEGGTWILRQALDEAKGDFWGGVGIYHSHDPIHQAAYLRKVLEWTLRLRDRAGSGQRARSTPQAVAAR
jgi:hypothetical protein